MLLRAAGVHLPNQAGISGSADEGADSIVVSGGYVDDEDRGDLLLYTGQGGRDSATGRQIADQDPRTTGNAALITSMSTGLPVRVTRGKNRDSPFAPKSGYSYAGLYSVTRWWKEQGKDDYLVVRFQLERFAGQADSNPRVRVNDETMRSLTSASFESPNQRLARILVAETESLARRLARSGPVNKAKAQHDAIWHLALAFPRDASAEMRRHFLLIRSQLDALNWDYPELDPLKSVRFPPTIEKRDELIRELRLRAGLEAGVAQMVTVSPDRVSKPTAREVMRTRADPGIIAQIEAPGFPADSRVESVLRSKLYKAQELRAGRRALSIEAVSTSLTALLAKGGRLSRHDLGRHLGLGPQAFEQTIAALRRILNVEGYAVISIDFDGESVVLDQKLLFEQFGVAG